MSEEDDGSKTEEPTAKKLQDAREKGQVAKSQEVTYWFSIFGALLVIGLLAPGAAGSLATMLGGFMTQLHNVPTDSFHLMEMLGETAWQVTLILALPLILLVVLALAGTLSQVGFLLTTESLKPDISRINPIKGAKRLFSMSALVDFGKGLLKISIVGLIGVLLLWPETRNLENYIGLTSLPILEEIWRIALILIIAVLIVLALIAGLDFMYQRYEHNRKLRMTLQEVRDEFKQVEGDPKVKARIRQIRTERARNRMMQAVPQADVVVTNPTHFAVALKYDPETMPAPVCVAKGVDLVAARIREVAGENKVPLVENPPLARALYATTELEQEVPVEHYQAVAEVISYVFKLQNKDMPKAANDAGDAG